MHFTLGIPFTSFHRLLNTHNSQGISFLRLCSYISKGNQT
nr:MAG TPA: hypothetical protein [Caudoviricetes sp.]